MDERPNKPVRRRWFLQGVLVVGLLASVGLILFGDRPYNGIRVEELEADLTRRLPYDSGWEQAEAWFHSHGFRPSTIAELGGRKIGLGSTIPNDSLLNSAEIHIALYFSPEGKLEKRIIYRFIYSL